MEKFRLNVCETKESCTFNSNSIGLKDSLEAMLEATLKALGQDGEAASAACFQDGSEEPIAIVYRMANGKIVYYTPDETLAGGGC